MLLISLLMLSTTRGYGSELKPASIVSGTVQSQFSMNVKIATCLPATVDNVAFGPVDAATIVSGEIEGHSTLSLDCSGTIKPQSISIRFEPATPHLTLGSSGYIGSKNPSLGYLVTWEDSQIGSINEGVPMGKELFFKKAEASLMKFKLKIKPVSLPLGGKFISLGNGDTHITIKIKYI